MTRQELEQEFTRVSAILDSPEEQLKAEAASREAMKAEQRKEKEDVEAGS